MKLIRTKREKLVFEISLSEKRLLFEVLKLYPLISATHHRLTKRPGPPSTTKTSGCWKSRSPPSGRKTGKTSGPCWTNPDIFKATASGLQLTLSGPEIEWLLQVLNDVRVGSWIALGSPDPESGKKIVFNEKILPHFRMMELAGAFEMVFLDALSGHAAG